MMPALATLLQIQLLGNEKLATKPAQAEVAQLWMTATLANQAISS